MRIAVIGPAHPLRGGIASTDEAFARALQKAGHECTLFSFSFQYPQFLFPGKTQYSEDEAPEDLVIESVISSINPLSWFKTARRVRAFDADIVFIRYWLPFMAPALGTVAKLLKKHAPVVGITDNVIPHERRTGDTALTEYFIKHCRAFITLSTSVREELKTLTNKPVLYLPHPLNDQFGEPVSKEEAMELLNRDPAYKYVLFFGLIRAYKGLDLLLRAFGRPELRDKKIKLVIAGEFYDSQEKYLNIIEEEHLEGRVIFENRFIPNDDVKYYFCSADLVAQTYRSASQSGITQIAYQFNVPMLVTDVGGLSEFVPHEKSGFVVEREPAGIARAIARFFDEDLYDRFSNNAREEKKKYLWSAFVERAINFADGLK